MPAYFFGDGGQGAICFVVVYEFAPVVNGHFEFQTAECFGDGGARVQMVFAFMHTAQAFVRIVHIFAQHCDMLCGNGGVCTFALDIVP